MTAMRSPTTATSDMSLSSETSVTVQEIQPPDSQHSSSGSNAVVIELALEKQASTDPEKLQQDGPTTPTVLDLNANPNPADANPSLKQKVLGQPIIPIFLSVIAGMAVAFQAGENATMRHAAGRSFASVVNFTVGLLACVLFFVVDVTLLKTPKPSFQRLKEAPLYSWLGGVLGTYYIIVNILVVPKLGAGTTLSVFVCAQVIMGCLMDHFGLVGVAKRPFTIWRILGSLSLIGCVAVITIF